MKEGRKECEGRKIQRGKKKGGSKQNEGKQNKWGRQTNEEGNKKWRQGGRAVPNFAPLLMKDHIILLTTKVFVVVFH